MLFKFIQQTWAHFGRSFTILDSNLLKRRTRLITFEVLLMALFFFYLPMLVLIDAGTSLRWSEVAQFLAYMAVLLVVDYLWVYRRVALSKVVSPQ